jgi:Rrf2 family iron-sulfur cluster assembly transcriptional regulator
MMDLALNGQENPVTLGEIAERQKVSQSYLEQIMGKLKSRNLVKSTRGPGGGYTLRFPTDKSNVHEIIKAVDEAPQRISIEDLQNAGSRELTDLLWQSIDDEITAYLEKITLADMSRKDLSSFNEKSHENTGAASNNADHSCDGNCETCKHPCDSLIDERTPSAQTFEPLVRCA